MRPTTMAPARSLSLFDIAILYLIHAASMSICARVAQLAEHSALNRQVAGSTPAARTKVHRTDATSPLFDKCIV